jgi:hypothetical protein
VLRLMQGRGLSDDESDIHSEKADNIKIADHNIFKMDGPQMHHQEEDLDSKYDQI